MTDDPQTDGSPHDEGPETTILAEDLARLALTERMAEVLEYLRLVRRGDHEPETIHQLRVWSRRAEAAMEVFAPFTPPRRAKWVRKRLKKVRRIAGEARDADVLGARWMKKAGDPVESGWRRLLERLERERNATFRNVTRLARELGRKDFGPRARAFLKRVRERRAEPEDPECDGGATAFAHQAIATASREFWLAEPVVLKNVDDLHAFRIAAKKLRYAVESCRAALPAAAVESCLKELTAIQDRLGKINDRASACVRLEKWRATAKRPAAALRLDALRDAEQRAMDSRVASLADWWKGARRVSLRERLFAISAPRPRRSDGAEDGESAEISPDESYTESSAQSEPVKESAPSESESSVETPRVE